MQPDDELCLCFHVTWRKVINFARINRIKLPSQLSDCESAGTGCGWCRAFMVRLVERLGQNPPNANELSEWMREHLPTSKGYAEQRRAYIDSGNGTPPRRNSIPSTDS